MTNVGLLFFVSLHMPKMTIWHILRLNRSKKLDMVGQSAPLKYGISQRGSFEVGLSIFNEMHLYKW